MKSTFTLLVLLGTVTFGFAQVKDCDRPGKVIVCHIPPGNPENMHEICISENGVAAHLAHGCYVGYCNEDNTRYGIVEEGQNDDFASHVSVFPNPFENELTVDMLFDGTTNVEVIVFDLKGNKVAVPYQGTVDGSLKLNWNASHLSSGLYITKVITPSKVYISKVNKLL